MSLHADIVKILNNEGAASEGGWHSWRCFDKSRYPKPCECTEVVASMVMSAALDAAREAVKQVCVDLNPDGNRSTKGNRWVTEKVAVSVIDALREGR